MFVSGRVFGGGGRFTSSRISRGRREKNAGDGWVVIVGYVESIGEYVLEEEEGKWME